MASGFRQHALATCLIVPPLRAHRGPKLDGDDMDDPDLDPLLTTPEAAKMLRLSARTLERRRLAGTEPRHIALGRAIRYRRRDLFDWIERSARLSTSEPPR